MKNFFYTLIFCLVSSLCFAQRTDIILNQYGLPSIYRVSTNKSKINLDFKGDKNTTLIKAFNQLPYDRLGNIVFLKGTQHADLTTRVRKDSLKYYRYSIIENDSNTIVSNALLSKVDFVWPKGSDFPGYLTMNLGIKNVVNKKLTIKIWRLPLENEVTTLIIYNKPIQPATILKVTMVSEPPSKKVKLKPSDYLLEIKNGDKVNVTTQTKLIGVSIKKTDIDFLYQVILKRKNNNGENISIFSNTWKYNTADGNPINAIQLSSFAKLGDYELIVAPQFGFAFDLTNTNGLNSFFSFSVASIPDRSKQDLIINILQISALFIILTTIIIFYIRRKNKRKLVIANLKAEIAKSELSGVRARLNPHFVYNALSGVQNLINKNEVENANEYLSKFARLTRSTLSEQALISLKDERVLLDDYLSMEQLRFKFSYEILLSESTNFEHIEIPAMLLQPFVENAVKHGVSNLKDEGKISVQFTKENKNLVLIITDNGKGFKDSDDLEGFGLLLSKKRIALLNQQYKECPIILTIDSLQLYTTIKITLINWL